MNDYQYRAIVYYKGKGWQDYTLTEPRDTIEQAMVDASDYLRSESVKVVQILKAYKTGINAGKFFLHQILK